MERFPCGSATVVPVRGEIDIATADRMRDDVIGAAAVGERRCVVVDLSRVTFFDASAVRAVLAAYKVLTAQGRHMVLAEPTPQVQRTLDALRIDELLDVYPIVEMALAHAPGHQGHVPGPGRD
ncbi:STAS domain-containing protein [Nocardiopsis chromatogenes]|uniref:STAS domain-containing protein n=1 Tax=Nocardiopsis chromatogenes TaxID=280239 RepID=UPI00047737FA|nr:STAS domain-containing protein [Nocardiopsis chromatogenes]